ncbi:hypothetical protein [Chromobacterium subtsugae]|uniref:hypothetical protein n=1 Tax=Chromobacterium subtsugae TaxID=251747 RepID=UPI000B29709A|nr:hypothetical protein [Chromobacterium subtsugae]
MGRLFTLNSFFFRQKFQSRWGWEIKGSRRHEQLSDRRNLALSATLMAGTGFGLACRVLFANRGGRDEPLLARYFLMALKPQR